MSKQIITIVAIIIITLKLILFRQLVLYCDYCCGYSVTVNKIAISKLVFKYVNKKYIKIKKIFFCSSSFFSVISLCFNFQKVSPAFKNKQGNTLSSTCPLLFPRFGVDY